MNHKIVALLVMAMVFFAVMALIAGKMFPTDSIIVGAMIAQLSTFAGAICTYLQVKKQGPQ